MTATDTARDDWKAEAKSVLIEDECERRGIKLQGRGIHRDGSCPQCNGVDRFSINTRKQVFRCRQCNDRGGDVIAMVEWLDDCSFNEACQILTNKEPPKNKPTGNGHDKHPGRAGAKKEPVATFRYADGHGKELFSVVRFHFRLPDGGFVLDARGKPVKEFGQKRPAPDGEPVQVWGLGAGEYMRRAPGGDWGAYNEERWAKLPASRERKKFPALDEAARRTPYRLPDLLAALKADRTIPILIVEGEGKVDALAKLGITATCCAEGAGKWTPGHAKHFSGADVVIAADNDEPGRKHRDAVAQSLKGIAARVRALELPDLPPKGDIIDWFKAGGTGDQLRKLIDEAPEREPRESSVAHDESDTDNDLVDMNRNHAVVNVAGKTRVITIDDKDLTFSTVDDFVQFHANRKRRWTDPDGNQKTVAVGKWWISHSRRRQHNGITFAPGVEQDAVNGKLNLWRGFACKPKKGDCSLYLKHIRDNICNGNAEYYEYLLNVMADAVQNPNKQGEVAVVVRSDDEGTGKGVFVKNFGQLFAPHFSHISQGSHLTGKFNAHLERCCVLFADECFWAGDKSHEGVLNAIVTEETIQIERKCFDVIQVPNRIHLFISSNNSWVVPASASARRWFILDVAPHQKQNLAYFAAIDKQMKAGGREALLHFLMQRELAGVDIRKVPQTEALARQKAHTRRGVDRLVEILAIEGTVPCGHSQYSNVAITTGEGENKGFYAHAKNIVPDLKFTASTIIATTLVTEWDCVRWKSGAARGIRFPLLKELRDKFVQKYGPIKWPPIREWNTD